MGKLISRWGAWDFDTLEALEALGEPICKLCGKPIAEDADFYDSNNFGLVHGECFDTWLAAQPEHPY